MGYYQVSKIIKMRRMALESKWEDFDVEGPAGMTVYRLEKDAHMGTERTYRRLTRSMGVEESLGQGILKTPRMEALVGMNEMMRSIDEKQYEVAEQWLEKIKTQIDMEAPRNKQYITAKQAELQYYQKKITDAEYEERLKEALAYTIPTFAKKGIDGWPLHDAELELVVSWNNCLKSQKKNEEQLQLADKVREILEQRYLNPELRNRYYVIASLALADAMGSLGRHREAIAVNKETIKLCQEKMEIRNIDHAYYDIFWNYLKLSEKETLTAAEEAERRQCLLMAYYISRAKGKTSPLYERRVKEEYPEEFIPEVR